LFVIGPAPRWCSFLENLTEELEETSLLEERADTSSNVSNPNNVYEDFKFVTKKELEDLGIKEGDEDQMKHFQPYMHGFFVKMEMYNSLRAVANPFEYEEYRKQLLKDKINKRRMSKIYSSSSSFNSSNMNSQLLNTSVNSKLAMRILERKKDKESKEESKVEDENDQQQHPEGIYFSLNLTIY